MKQTLLFIGGVALLVSCSTPKFASQPGQGTETKYAHTVEPASPFPVDESTLVASTADRVYLPAKPAAITGPSSSKPVTHTPAEKKELKKEAVKQIKAYTRAVKDGDKALATELKQAMDNDLKMAAIFGVAGIVSFIIGGDVFHVIGAIALIVGVVFFVKWMLRQ